MRLPLIALFLPLFPLLPSPTFAMISESSESSEDADTYPLSALARHSYTPSEWRAIQRKHEVNQLKNYAAPAQAHSRHSPSTDDMTLPPRKRKQGRNTTKCPDGFKPVQRQSRPLLPRSSSFTLPNDNIPTSTPSPFFETLRRDLNEVLASIAEIQATKDAED